jgi:phosphoglycolate phosphatase
VFFIFDWDGTLCDSLDKIVFAAQSAAAEVGLPVPSVLEAKEIIGLSLTNAVEQLFPGISVTKRDAMAASYGKFFNYKDGPEMKFFPGVKDTLDALREDGHRIAIATGKSRRGLNKIFDEMDLQNYFHASRCADETASKPHPQMLQELLHEAGVKVDAAIMIGDTEFDMAMARTIDMRRMAVSYGAHHIDRLKTFDPVLCIDQFPQLLHWEQ